MMISRLFALILFIHFIILIHAEEKRTTKTNEQLYEVYKTMRSDPRFDHVSNNELIGLIYRIFIFANNDESPSIKQRLLKSTI